MKRVLLLAALLILSQSAASADPIVSKQSYAVGPYNVSFDLLGCRDLTASAPKSEEFEAKASPGIRHELSLKDNYTGEAIEFQILKYDRPIAREAAAKTSRLEGAVNIADSAYKDWLFRYDTFAGFSASQAIDDYTMCFVTSTMSWTSIETMVRSLRVELQEK